MYETIRVGEMSVTFLKTRHETYDAFDLFELTIPPFARVVLPHIHRKYDETIFGVDGTMTWTLHKDGKDMPNEVRRGTTLFIPRGTPHFYANRTHARPASSASRPRVFSVPSITSKSPSSTAATLIPTWRASAPS